MAGSCLGPPPIVLVRASLENPALTPGAWGSPGPRHPSSIGWAPQIWKRGFFLAAAVLFLGLVCGGIRAGELVIPRVPDQWATDTAGFLSSDAVAALNSELRSFEESTGHQILVYIGKTTAGYPIEEFAVKAFKAWKPGRKGLDDGLILFIMAEDRKIRIEVGYGLEDQVTDALSSRIINDILVPRIRAGENDGAVKDAVAALFAAVSGKTFEGQPQTETPAPGVSKRSPIETVFIVIAVIFFLIILITHPSLALWLLFNFLGGGMGGGRGGGGFRGGGGRSGGGGASGGW